MNIFLEEHQKLVADMLAERVEFILIGGYRLIIMAITAQQVI